MSEWTETVKQFKKLKICLYPEREYSHKVACREPATHKSVDKCPSCEWHQNFTFKDEWKGYVEGA